MTDYTADDADRYAEAARVANEEGPMIPENIVIDPAILDEIGRIAEDNAKLEALLRTLYVRGMADALANHSEHCGHECPCYEAGYEMGQESDR